MTDEELANLREERESVTEQIERQEKALVDTAMSIARMQGGECSPRMRTAAELFEKGETDKAEAVLKEDDMEADATNAKLKFRYCGAANRRTCPKHRTMCGRIHA